MRAADFIANKDSVVRTIAKKRAASESIDYITHVFTTHTDDPDSDGIADLVGEVVPQNSCLVFCSTKIACQNLADNLARLVSTAGTSDDILSRRSKLVAGESDVVSE